MDASRFVGHVAQSLNRAFSNAITGEQFPYASASQSPSAASRAAAHQNAINSVTATLHSLSINDDNVPSLDSLRALYAESHQ